MICNGLGCRNNRTFDSWLAEQDENAQDKILASLLVLSELGPNLGRPHVDTIKESKYPNMKRDTCAS